MNAVLRNSLIVGGSIAGIGALVYAFSQRSEDVKAERKIETPFDDIAGSFMAKDANGDGRIDRKTEVVTFSEGGLKTGPTYSSVRQAADAADMIVGNRDGFAQRDEFADLARMYTTRPGAIGLNANESSVFYEDYRTRAGDGGTPDEMRGNPYF